MQTVARWIYSFRFLAPFVSPSNLTTQQQIRSIVTKKMQNKWTPYQTGADGDEARQYRLRLMNSLTRDTELFKPVSGNQVP